MVTLLLDTNRPRGPKSESPIVTLWVTAFVIVVLICSAMLSPILWTTMTVTSSQESPTTVAQCSTVGDGNSRLACYDKVAGRPLPQPAKGANAPFNHPAR